MSSKDCRNKVTIKMCQFIPVLLNQCACNYMSSLATDFNGWPLVWPKWSVKMAGQMVEAENKRRAGQYRG